MTENKQFSRTYIIIILIITFVFPGILFADRLKLSEKNDINQLLLLNSGLVDCKTAMVKYILWTEQSSESIWIERQLPLLGLSWNKEVLTNYYGQKAYKYTAEVEVNQESEGTIIYNLNLINNKIQNTRIKLFIEQRVDSVIDPSAYVANTGIELKEYVTADDLVSLRGFLTQLQEIGVQEDEMNFHLITSNSKETETPKTILAIPAII